MTQYFSTKLRISGCGRGEWEGENGCRHPVMAAHTAPYIHSTSRQIYENTCIYVYI